MPLHHAQFHAGYYRQDLADENAMEEAIKADLRRQREQEAPEQRTARELRERACEASAEVVRLVRVGAPIEQVQRADEVADGLWLQTWGWERRNRETEELQAEVDMLNEDEEEPTCYACGGTPETCTCTMFAVD